MLSNISVTGVKICRLGRMQKHSATFLSRRLVCVSTVRLDRELHQDACSLRLIEVWTANLCEWIVSANFIVCFCLCTHYVSHHKSLSWWEVLELKFRSRIRWILQLRKAIHFAWVLSVLCCLSDLRCPLCVSLCICVSVCVCICVIDIDGKWR